MNKTTKKPEITILMPVYNGEKYLKEAINSILAQTFTDFIFMIIDDGSTDNSVKIIKSYTDQRIELLINKKNLGLSKSLNIGIENSNTKYIARMDCDDISLPNRIEEQFKFMEKNPDIGVCGTYIEVFGIDTPQIYKYPTKNADIKVEFLFQNPIAHPTVMIRRAILEKNNLKYNDYYGGGAEDYDLWERMSSFVKFGNIPKVLLRYRMHKNQLGQTYPALKRQDMIDEIQKRQYERLGVEKDNLSALLKANKKYYFYNNWALRKIVYKMYYRKFKSFIKNILYIHQ